MLIVLEVFKNKIFFFLRILFKHKIVLTAKINRIESHSFLFQTERCGILNLGEFRHIFRT